MATLSLTTRLAARVSPHQRTAFVRTRTLTIRPTHTSALTPARRRAVQPPGRRGRCLSAASAPTGMTGAADINWEPTPEVLATWKSADVVCFDVDSTLCEDESIDELAGFLGCGERVAALTSQAMGGSVPFQDALASRLDAMQVSAAQMEAYLASHPPLISPGIRELVNELHAQGKAVYLVSGGFRQIIEPVAAALGIPKSNIYANSILYGDDGNYAGFDRAEFTSRSGGKPAALRKIKEDGGYKVAVMVGDGATDMEARKEGVAALFVGYGGVVQRENIARAADWYVTNFDGLIQALRS